MRACDINHKRFVRLSRKFGVGWFLFAMMGAFTSRSIDIFGLELSQQELLALVLAQESYRRQ